MHVDEEQLQRLVDDELAEPADEWVHEHMTYCDSCRDRVGRARREQDEVLALLGSLDHPRPRVDHVALMARGRRTNSSWMAKAAGFVAVAALAGAAYAASGSPLPSFITNILGRGKERSASPVVQPGLPEPKVSGVTVAAGRQMVIDFTSDQSAGEIQVSLSDGDEIEVRVMGPGASFSSGDEQLTVENIGSSANYVVAIPRRSPQVEIRIAGEQVFLKNGDGVVSDHKVSNRGSYLITLVRKR